MDSEYHSGGRSLRVCLSLGLPRITKGHILNSQLEKAIVKIPNFNKENLLLKEFVIRQSCMIVLKNVYESAKEQ